MEYTTLKSDAIVAGVVSALKERGMIGHSVATGADALEMIKELIPAGASVTNGASQTLEQIGYIEYLKEGRHGWNNLQGAIVAEKDMEKQRLMRKQASIADFYLGSVHAAAETGEIVIASATGSQMPAITSNASNLIFVVSTKKIMKTLDEALQRLKEHVFSLEDARMKSVGVAAGSLLAKILILEHEHPMMGRNVHVIFVHEDLGF